MSLAHRIARWFAPDIFRAIEVGFPHFMNGESVTAERIKTISAEWHEMVGAWAPFPLSVTFYDQNGEARRLEYESFDEGDGYVMPDDADWEVQCLAKTALEQADG